MTLHSTAHVRTYEVRVADIIERDAKQLEVRHLRAFLAEVDRLGIADDARVTVKDELNSSNRHHTVQITAKVEQNLAREELAAQPEGAAA